MDAKENGRKRWIIGCLVALVLVPIVLIIAGAGYQALASAVDARRYPMPGRLVDIGGARMHLYCTGERQAGLPTVILVHSHPATVSSWAWIQPEISTAARTCSYDRLGSGWSDPSPKPPTMRQMAQDLHALLEKSGEAGPYLLVGHSFGGAVTRLFTAAYPEQVSGLVWIEATHPDAWTRREAPESTLGGMSPQMVQGIPLVTRLSLFRLFPSLMGPWGKVPELPDQPREALEAYFHTSKWAEFVVAVDKVLPESLEQLRLAGDVGDTPLAVVTGSASGEADSVGTALQQELAGLSTRSQVYTINGANHSTLVHAQSYAHEVSAVILAMINQAR